MWTKFSISNHSLLAGVSALAMLAGASVVATGDVHAQAICPAGSISSGPASCTISANLNNLFIFALADGTLIIDEDVTISGAASGVEATGRNQTVTNNGTIMVNDVGILSEGVDATIVNNESISAVIGIISRGDDARITNNGNITPISTGDALRIRAGIFSEGRNAKILNKGHIHGTGFGIVSRGDNALIINSGTIMVNDDGNRDGILSEGVDATIINNNTITSGDDGIESSGANATITNNNTITSGDDGIESSGANATIINKAIITSEDDGLKSTGANGTIVNTGNITAGDDGISSTSNSRNARITNRGTITADDDGIYSTGVDAKITNSGNITAGGYGVHANGALTRLTNQSGGVIRGGGIGVRIGFGTVVNRGLIEGYTGIVSGFEDSPLPSLEDPRKAFPKDPRKAFPKDPRNINVSITNAGTIRSTAGPGGLAIKLAGPGFDTLTLLNGSVIEGLIKWDGIGDTLNYRAKRSAVLSFTGPRRLVPIYGYGGPMPQGPYGGPIPPGPGGRPGEIGGMGGRQLNVENRELEGPREVVELEDPREAVEKGIEQDEDVQLVDGGPGGNAYDLGGYGGEGIAPYPEIGPNGTMAIYTPEQFKVNAGGRPVVWSAHPFGVSVVIIDPTAFALADNILFDTTSAISAAVTGQAAAWRATRSGGRIISPAADVIRSDGHSISEGGWFTRLWADLFGGVRDEEGDGALGDARHDFGGVVAGAETGTAAMRVGFFIGGSVGKADIEGGSQDIDITTVFGGPYFSAEGDGVAVDGMVTFGLSDYDSTRSVNDNLIAGGVDSAKADYNGFFVAPEITVSSSLGMVRPSLTLRYAGLFLESYSEESSILAAQGAGLNVDDRDIHQISARAQLGLPLTMDEGRLSTELRVGAEGRAQLGKARVRGSVLGQGFTFDAGGDDEVLTGFGGFAVAYAVSSRFTLNGNVEGAYGTDEAVTGRAHLGAKLEF